MWGSLPQDDTSLLILESSQVLVFLGMVASRLLNTTISGTVGYENLSLWMGSVSKKQHNYSRRVWWMHFYHGMVQSLWVKGNAVFLIVGGEVKTLHIHTFSF